MKVLVACECSGRVKSAFRKLGHDAWSCDVKPSEIPDDSYHIQGDVIPILTQGWDLLIAHPPCTYLAVIGSPWLDSPLYPNRRQDQQKAFEFFMKFATADIERIAIENPIGVVSTLWRKPTQIIQPYYFGEEFSKTTCLWLKNLPKLRYGKDVQLLLGETGTPPQSEIVGKGEFKISSSGRRGASWNWWLPPGELRSTIRSRTFAGIANAMADQWGNL